MQFRLKKNKNKKYIVNTKSSVKTPKTIKIWRKKNEKIIKLKKLLSNNK